MNIPIFRAKKIDSDDYIIGYLKFDRKHNHYSINPIDDENTWHKIKENTLAIHFPNMTDTKGDKIFASLQEDGKGGDIIISKSYPFYGDAPEITDSSGKCEELNYKGLLLFTSTGCYMDYIKISDRVRGCATGCAIEDFNEFESIGIQK